MIRRALVRGLFFLLTMLMTTHGLAQATLEGASRSFAPAALPVVYEALRVEIDEQHARVTLEQHYRNPSGERLEGRFLFRTGEGARVNGLRYWNGEQEIVGEVFEREVARQVYQEVTGLERDPALFEQVGEGVFSFRIFPIEPGEVKRIEVRYDVWLTAHADRVELRVPVSGANSRGKLVVRDPRGLSELRSPSHELTVAQTQENELTVELGKAKGTADSLVLQYRVGSPPLSLQAAFHRSADQDGYLLLHLATPDKVGRDEVSAKDVTLVIDHSGSMTGEPLEHARAAARQLVQGMDARDRVNLAVFDDRTELVFPEPQPLTPQVRAQLLRTIDRLESAGGTDIALALKTVLAAQNRDAQPNVVLFMTDGQSDPQAALQAAHADTADTRVFTVGLGSGVEKPLLARIAADKRGRFLFIRDVTTIESEVARLYRQIAAPLVTDLQLSFSGAQVSGVYPRTLPDLFVDDELRIFARVRAEPSATAPLRATLRGTVKGRPVQYEATIASLQPIERRWLGQAWGQARVEDLLQEIALHGEQEELKNEAIELALAYNFITPYTSFLAIPASELTDGARDVLMAARDRKRRIREAHPDAAKLSRSDMPPGDPVISVLAPSDARHVLAVFPFGLSLDLSWDAMTEHWTSRFLVPKTVKDGVYQVQVWIEHNDGTLEHTQVAYTIDSTADEVLVQTSEVPGGLLVRVLTDAEPREVRAMLLGQPDTRALLSPGVQMGCSAAFIAAAPGRHTLRLVVTDRARNELVKSVPVELHGLDALSSLTPEGLCP